MAYKLLRTRIPNPVRGFTLMEILIALFIFTIVALIITKSLHSILATQTATEMAAEQLTETQMALLLLSRDLEQALDRPILNATGQIEGSFIGNRSSLTLTHHGLANPAGSLQSSSLQRSRYRLEKDQLIRDTWIVLDQGPHAIPYSRVLLSKIQTVFFRYLDNKNVFHDFWPLGGEENPKALLIPTDSAAKLPRAVEVNFTFDHGRHLQQTYLLPQQEVPHDSH